MPYIKRIRPIKRKTKRMDASITSIGRRARRHFAPTTYVPRPTHDERRDDDPDAAMLALRRRTPGEEQRVALDDDDDATTGSQS